MFRFPILLAYLFSLWKWLLTILWVMSVYKVCVKNLGKHSLFLPYREFRGYLARWSFSRSTCEMTDWYNSSNSNHVLHMWPFHGFLYSQASRKTALIFITSLIFSPISHTHHLQLNLHKYREMIDWITTKFGMELKPTKASWKSQLYTLNSPSKFLKLAVSYY